jgi:polyisoprenyl-teichoic acid--peptidoglycan teichoic acid transferase
VTEVAPHVGRRARREAESRHTTADSPTGRAPYGATEPMTGYLPPVNPGRAPGWHPEANEFAPSSGYSPGGGWAQPPGAPGGPGDPNGYAPRDAQPAGIRYPQPAGPHYSQPAGPPPAQALGHPHPAPRANPAGYGGNGGRGDGDPGEDDGGSPRGRHATEWGQGFERVVGWTLLGSVVPGAGMIAAGRRKLGWAILGSCILVTVAAGAVVLVSNPVQLFTQLLLTHPERFTYLAIGLILLAGLWGAHIVVTNVSLRRFATLTAPQSALSWLLVAVLVGVGAAGALLGGQQARLGQATLNALFPSDAALSAGAKRPDASKPDPWAKVPRINVLLIGSDAGADRTGLRTDSLVVASINTKTGQTVLFSLPRNLEHVPFPTGSAQARDYPDGYVCAQHACMINALWQFGMEHKDQYYKGVANPGLTATVQGVEGALGIHIDDSVMLDLRGFMSFIDAVGGLDINVGPKQLPVGGHRDATTGVETGVTSYLKPGRQHLNGYQALWFARSRSESDDFERMRRQRCVIAAITQQVNPQSVALNLSSILQAAKDNIRTSIPLTDLGAWVTLALRVKGHVKSVAFTNNVITSSNPDFGLIQTKVQEALNPPAATATKAAPTAKATPSPAATAKTHRTTPTPSPTATENGSAVDVTQVC